MKNVPIILMTACINPQGMPHTIIQDRELRKRQYFKALDFYLKETSYRIVFVENSGYDISVLYNEQIENKRLEVLTYNGNNFDKVLGKGYGEGLILEYAFTHSVFMNDNDVLIIKVFGRHIVKNIKSLFKVSLLLANKKNFISCDINPQTNSAISDFFVATRDFYAGNLMNKISIIDESKGIWFEHVLYFSIIDFVNMSNGWFVFLPFPLKQRGYSGSTGEKIISPTYKRYLQNIIKSVLYYMRIMNISRK